MNRITKVFNDLLDFAFPSHCFSCSRAVEGGKLICDDCKKLLENVKTKICIKCGRTIKKCDCNRYVYHFSGVCAPFFNEGIAKNGLYRLKFSGQHAIVPFYADAMIEAMAKNYFDIKFDGIVFVPMSPLKNFFLGYNQAEWLAQSISEKTGIPLIDGILYRRIFTKTQHKSKGIIKRFLNAFKSYKHKGTLNGGIYLLVDDIKTTGASLDACAKELLYAGADEIFCVTALISNKTVEKNS